MLDTTKHDPEPSQATAAAAPATVAVPLVPIKQAVALCSTNFSQGVMLTLPFTIGVYMVRSWEQGQGREADEQRVGQMTGLLAAYYSFAQFTTSYAWGLASNRCGRKPVILVGNAVSVAGLLVFGMAPTYTMAAVARAVSGLLNGIIGAWKCMIGESMSPLAQGQMFGYMSLAWGMGTIMGPALGGALAQHCGKWPGAPLCGPGQLFAVRPYLLPCLLAAVTSLLSLLLAALLLEETLPALVQARQGGQGCSSSGSSSSTQAWLRQQLQGGRGRHSGSGLWRPWAVSGRHLPLQGCCTSMRGVPGLQQPEEEEEEDRLGLLQHQQEYSHQEQVQQKCAGLGSKQAAANPFSSKQAAANPFSSKACEVEMESIDLGGPGSWSIKVEQQQGGGGPQGEEEEGAGRAPGAAQLNEYSTREQQQQGWQQHAAGEPAGEAGERQQLLGCQPEPSYDMMVTVQEEGGEGQEERGSTAGKPAAVATNTTSISASSPGGRGPWHRDRQVVLVLLGYTLVCLLFCALDEVAPMWASAPADKGGLALSEQQLAAPLAAGGAVLMAFSVWGFPRLQARLGTLTLARLGLALAALVCIAVPLPSLLAARGSSTGAQVLLYLALALKAPAQCSAFTGAIIMVNAAPAAEQLGAVNGVGQSLASLVRGAGPALGGALWAACLRAPVPGHQFLTFGVVACVAVAAEAVYRRVHLPHLK